MDCLKLSAYSEAFRKENVTGNLLLDLDDHTLEQDLGVKSRLHRIHILRLITGKSSAKNILEHRYEGVTGDTNSETAEYLTPVEPDQNDKTVS